MSDDLEVNEAISESRPDGFGIACVDVAVPVLREQHSLRRASRDRQVAEHAAPCAVRVDDLEQRA